MATKEKHAAGGNAMVAKKQRGMKEPALVVVGFLKSRGSSSLQWQFKSDLLASGNN